MINKKFDFSELERLSARLIKGDHSITNLTKIKKELNLFFNDSKCEDLIFTDNDGMLFGMKVYAVLAPGDVSDILNTNNQMRIRSYDLEIDSKLLSPLIGLNEKELVAIFLHEIGHLVNDGSAINKTRKIIEINNAKNRLNLKQYYRNNATVYHYIFKYAILDIINKTSSMFYYNKEELVADEFAHEYGYNGYIKSALIKINKNLYDIHKEYKNKMVVLAFCSELFINIYVHRLPSLDRLVEMEKLTNSELEKRSTRSLLNGLSDMGRLDINESTIALNESLLKKYRYDSIKGLQDDIYEYTLRARHIDTEDEALYLLRSVNTRIEIIDGYLYREKSISDHDKKKLQLVLDEYLQLRSDISKNATYASSRELVIAKYPEIVRGRS